MSTTTPSESTSITYTGEPARIDRVLCDQLPHTRNFFHHIISRGAVTLQRSGSTQVTPVKKSTTVKPGDTIRVDSLERFIDGGVLEEAVGFDLKILHDHPDYMVIYKPKNTLSHPNSVRDISQPSVVGAVYQYMKAQGADGCSLPSSGSFVRAGLVHRLDRDTDGVMIIAKTERGLAHFSGLFQAKSRAETIEEKEAVRLKKFYRANVIPNEAGRLLLAEIASGALNLPYYIKGDVTPKTPHPVTKYAISKIVGVSSNNDGSHQINVEILTGRTHQIRIHLSENGLPIRGDDLYGVLPDGLMELTAERLEFEDVDGERVVVYK